MTEPFPLVDVAGPAYERGLQHGVQAAERIQRGIRHYGAQLNRLSLDHAEVKRLVHDYLPVMRDFDESHVEEMRGIAAGAGLSFEEVALLNARTEILKLAERPALRAELAAVAQPDGCTGVIVLPEATRDGQLIHALNWDWKHDCAESSIVLRIRRDDGPDILTFTEAGALARAGFNAAGVAITGNYLECDRDYSRIGVPVALIRRKALESAHLALAMRAVAATPKSASSNMMVSHAVGFGIDLECAPDETFHLLPERGLLVHANHWESTAALAKLKERGIAAMPDSLFRAPRVRALLAPQVGALGVAEVKAALFDDMLTPWAVCRPPRPNPAGVMTATVAMIVMQPAAGVMEVAPLPALNRHFATYRLDDATSVAAARATVALA